MSKHAWTKVKSSKKLNQINGKKKPFVKSSRPFGSYAKKQFVQRVDRKKLNRYPNQKIRLINFLELQSLKSKLCNMWKDVLAMPDEKS